MKFTLLSALLSVFELVTELYGQPVKAVANVANSVQRIPAGYDTQKGAFLRLIDIATTNRIPLGIVLEPQLCTARLQSIKGLSL